MRCVSCGKELTPEALFCMTCGAEVLNALTQVRKTVTILFSDVAGSTSLADSLDPETVRRVMGRYFDTCRSVLQAHGGTVEKFIGDAVMAVFGVPVVHEDDALRAVRAAQYIKDALARLNRTFEREHGVRLVVRTGINTGEVMAGDPGSGQAFVSGDAVNVAARLEQAAPDDAILISETTRQLVRDAVTVEATEPLTLKGKPHPFPAFRLVDVDPSGDGLLRRSGGSLVGRRDQLAMLESTLDRALRARRCFLVTVIGEPGVGKSRLVEAFTERASSRASVLRGRCLSYGEGITFFPVAEIVSQALDPTGGADPDELAGKIERLIARADDAPLVAQRLLRMLGLDPTGSQGVPEEIYWAFRKLLEGIAAVRGGIIVVIDDIQWAEPALLDLLEHVCDLAHDSAIMLVCMARPDIFDDRPGWSAGRPNTSTIVLEPLNDADSRAMASQLVEAATLLPSLMERILEAADGNPLFLEQVVAHLIDAGLTAERGELAAISIPLSLTALLEARLDRLSDLQRAVLQRGSIEGQVFHRGAVSSLLPPELRADVATSFGPLMLKEFIASGEAELAGEDAFRFRHALIKDVAYAALPKEVRAELHERLADWLEVAAGSRLPEFEEIVGYHLETAVRYQLELGRSDTSSELASRAVAHLETAGGLASGRGDVHAAASILQRALVLTPPGPSGRIPMLLLLAETSESAGRTDEARAVWQELDEAFQEISDPRQRAAIEIQRLNSIVDEGDRSTWSEEVEVAVGRAIEIFDREEDHTGSARAHFLGGVAEWAGFRASSAAIAWRLVAEHAHAAGETALQAAGLSWVAAIHLYGTTHVKDAVQDLKAIELEVAGSAAGEAAVAGILASCFAMGGHEEEAREALGRALGTWREHGLEADIANYGSQYTAWVERCAGYPDAELQAWLDGLDASRRLDQENRFLASAAAVLLAARGEIDEAGVMVAIAHPGDWT